MKAIVSGILAAAVLVLGGLSARAQESLVVSGWSFSASLFGMELGYEKALFGSVSVVLRAGMPSVMVDYEKTTNNTDDSYSSTLTVNFGPRPGFTVEPRLYTNLARRARFGLDKENNLADFISLRAIIDTPDYERFSVSVTPMYGLRRGSRHWFREYTFGLGYHSLCTSLFPHLNFRLGYTF